MKYLFYDCECANSFDKISKICSIGYCLCDTDFNLINKEDIIVNPEAPFDYHLYNKKSDVQLSYTKKEFYNAPTYKEHYKKIEKLFTSDVIVFGFSLDNDIKFILDANKRYNLLDFNFKYLDVQTIYRLFSNEENNTSLDKALLELGVDIRNEVLHKSDDDAYMTMLLLKEIMQRLNTKSLRFILDKYNLVLGSVEDFKHKKLLRQEMKERKKLLYQESRDKLKNLLPLYGKLCDKPISNKYSGMRFAFSNQVIKFVDKAILAQKIIYNNGGTTLREMDSNSILIVGNKERLDKLSLDGIKYIRIEEILG